MMSIRRAFALSRAERRLFVEAVATLVHCRARLAISDVKHLRGWTRISNERSGGVDEVLTALARALRLYPRATCLVRALAAQRMLARRGHASQLAIGVRREAGDFAAHAWLTHDGRVIVGGDQTDTYARLDAWEVTPAGAPR